MARTGAQGQERAVEVRRHHATPLAEVHIGELAADSGRSGIGEHGVDTATRGLDRRRERPLGVALICDVAEEGPCIHTKRSQRVDRSVVLGVVAAPQHDVGTGRSAPCRQRQADAAVPTGHHHRPARELSASAASIAHVTPSSDRRAVGHIPTGRAGATSAGVDKHRVDAQP
ncbi:MAG: hypothetical protein R2689_06220 [Microthrixaceae bacterium]